MRDFSRMFLPALCVLFQCFITQPRECFSFFFISWFSQYNDDHSLSHHCTFVKLRSSIYARAYLSWFLYLFFLKKNHSNKEIKLSGLKRNLRFYFTSSLSLSYSCDLSLIFFINRDLK